MVKVKVFICYHYCLRPKAKDLRITRVVAVVVVVVLAVVLGFFD